MFQTLIRMFRLLLATTALLPLVAAEWKPCGQDSPACCNPGISPAQLCPGGVPCEACGGGNSCECPGIGPAPSPPGPSPHPGPGSSTRLTVVNGCASRPLWIAHIVSNAVGPDPQDVKIEPGKSAIFHTSNPGGGALSATRFWPKMGCNASGSDCGIGDSGGPGESCVIRTPGKPDDYSQCAPPIDSKFEATFGAPGTDAMDVVDMSLVDGFSLPFKLEVTGGSCTRQGQPFQKMDCSALSFNQCPTAETLNSKTVNLRAVNPKTGKTAGCFSPCMKLTDDKWNKSPVPPGSPQAAPYCCQGADGSPGTCTAGPILETQYLKSVKESCPDAYGYAYDDKSATIACTTSTEYTVTFYCPSSAEELSQILV